jgi:hypothetical protein
LICLCLSIIFFTRFNLQTLESGLPIPSQVRVVKEESREADENLRQLIHLESGFTADVAYEFYSTSLQEHGWQIVNKTDKAISAKNENRSLRMVFHQESHRSLITVNINQKR